MSAPLSTSLAAAIRAVVTQLQERPNIWGPLHLGPLLREHLPTPAYGYLLEVRGALGLSGMGSLKNWSDGLTAEEAVKELKRLLVDTTSTTPSTSRPCAHLHALGSAGYYCQSCEGLLNPRPEMP